MELSAYASDITSAQVQSQISTAVLKKGQDAQKQQGEAAIALIESAAQIAQVGPDGRLDVTG